jgi:hypothetical protein
MDSTDIRLLNVVIDVVEPGSLATVTNPRPPSNCSCSSSSSSSKGGPPPPPPPSCSSSQQCWSLCISLCLLCELCLIANNCESGNPPSYYDPLRNHPVS